MRYVLALLACVPPAIVAVTACGGAREGLSGGSGQTGDGGSGIVGLNVFADSGSDATCPGYVTCADRGFDCGLAGDGCGGTLDCGACTGGETCGGGGQANVCGSASCTPRTCASLAYDCGMA